jgi:hypothetical protein
MENLRLFADVNARCHAFVLISPRETRIAAAPNACDSDTVHLTLSGAILASLRALAPIQTPILSFSGIRAPLRSIVSESAVNLRRQRSNA